MKIPFLKETTEQIEAVSKEERSPVSIETIEDMIKLITVASEINCNFTLELELEIGNFCVKSSNFKDIKMLKATKTQPDRLIISHSNALLVIDTTIELQHVIGMVFTLDFKSDINGI